MCVCPRTYTCRRLQRGVAGKQSLTGEHFSLPSSQPHKENSVFLVFPTPLCSQGNEKKKDRSHWSWKEEGTGLPRKEQSYHSKEKKGVEGESGWVGYGAQSWV